MPGSKYELYGKPVPPADPNAEYMTVQETAYVLKCSVKMVTRLLDELGAKTRVGRAIVTDRATRAALYEHRTQGPKRIRRPRRPRKTAAPKASKSSAAKPATSELASAA